MNRAYRRAAKRDVEKAAETINKLTPNQVKLIDKISAERAYERAESILISYQRVVNASLAEHGFNIKEIEGIFNVANDLMKEEEEKSIELNKELKRSGDIEMAKKRIEIGVLDEINTLMDAGKNRKEVIEAVLFKFPNMSKAMIINAYQEVKESRRQQEDPEINKAAEQILNIIEGEDSMNNKEVEKAVEEWKETVNPVVVTKATVQQANLNPQEESKLQVLAMTLKGENGVYRVCSEGVELTRDMSMMFFENANQLDKFTEEYKKVFEMMKA